MAKDLEIVNSSLDGVPEITLRGMIDEYEDGAIASAIDRCGSPKLRMNINSIGGNVNLGQEVIAAMQMFKDNGGIIETVNRGVAYSTAGWIFSAGSKGHRKMLPFSTLVTHPPMFADGKTLSDFQKGSEKWNILSEAMEKLIDIFVPITGCSRAKIKNFMVGNTKFDAKKAVKEGFADTIVEISNSVVLKNNLQPEEIINATESIQYEIVNQEPAPGDNNNKQKMKEVAKLLNLNPDAAEGSILQAITDLQNRAKTLEESETALKTKLETVEAERDSIKNELSAVKDAEIINYVKKYVGDDKVRKENEPKLLNMAKSDFELFKTVCPVTEVDNKGAIIDNGINPEGNEGDKDAKKIEDAKKFYNMSQPERVKLEKENPSEYRKLVNAYNTTEPEKIV